MWRAPLAQYIISPLEHFDPAQNADLWRQGRGDTCHFSPVKRRRMTSSSKYSGTGRYLVDLLYARTDRT